MIVVDTNAVAYLCLPSEHSARAEALYARDSEWAAPLLWRSEFRNVLLGFLRRGHLEFEQALEVLGEAEALFAGREFEVPSGLVLELARDSACSAYDCEFVALAIRLGTRLATLDRKLLAAFPEHTEALPFG